MVSYTYMAAAMSAPTTDVITINRTDGERSEWSRWKTSTAADGVTRFALVECPGNGWYVAGSFVNGAPSLASTAAQIVEGLQNGSINTAGVFCWRN